MEPFQIVFLVFLGLFLVLNIRRLILGRSIPQVEPSELPPGAVLLDVRTEDERSRDHIGRSLHIPLHQLKSRAGELSRYKEKQIICYCATGNRSLNAAVQLKKMGYSTANMKGGISNWNSQGLKK